MWISPVRAVHVSFGPLNVLIVTGDFLKMLSMVRMTLTCVETRMLVPRKDLGATLLTLKFDGNIATYPDVLQEVFMKSIFLFLSQFGLTIGKPWHSPLERAWVWASAWFSQNNNWAISRALIGREPSIVFTLLYEKSPTVNRRLHDDCKMRHWW